MVNRYVLYFFTICFLIFLQCTSTHKKGNLLLLFYSSYQPEREFIFYDDTIEVLDRNDKLILKMYIKENNLLIDSLSFGQFKLKHKNIYNEIITSQIEIHEPIDTLKIDLCKNNWQQYTESLMIDELKLGDTLRIIGVDFHLGWSKNHKSIKIWKAQDSYFVNLLKINKDSTDNDGLFTKKLGREINDIRRLEIELRKIKKLSRSCEHPTNYYLIKNKDTLQITDATCNDWNGLSELYYILNGFSKD